MSSDLPPAVTVPNNTTWPAATTEIWSTQGLVAPVVFPRQANRPTSAMSLFVEFFQSPDAGAARGDP
jgi:hypothetical protein